MNKRCCELCLDESLCKVINPDFWSTSEDNACSYCESSGSALVRVNRLSEYFEWARVIYIPTDTSEGEPLLSWLRKDWGIFSRLSESVANRLLEDIFCDEKFDISLKLIPDSLEDENNSERWRKQKEEIQHRNRWPIGHSTGEKSIFDEVIDYLNRLDSAEINMDESYYRARLYSSQNPFTAKDLGAPPREKAGHGRLNPAGIPYLYLASEKSTAIAEVRPHPGQKVVTATFQIDADENEGMKIANLVDVASLFSPFDYLESTPILRARDFQEMIREIAQEFSRPVEPGAAAYQYVPTQYLCELLKREGFDGVIYSSALSKGHNLVLFEPEKSTIQPDSLEEHYINAVEIHYETAN